jgi:hypothetical protein
MVGRADFVDAFGIELPHVSELDAEALARAAFEHAAPWVAVVLRLRDALVRPLGLKTTASLSRAGGERIGFFRVFARHPDEIILGEDDAHLDFRVSLLLHPPGASGNRRVSVSTVVFQHGRLGRVYLALIEPFHRLVVRSALRRIERRAAGPVIAE